MAKAGAACVEHCGWGAASGHSVKPHLQTHARLLQAWQALHLQAAGPQAPPAWCTGASGPEPQPFCLPCCLRSWWIANKPENEDKRRLYDEPDTELELQFIGGRGAGPCCSGWAPVLG